MQLAHERQQVTAGEAAYLHVRGANVLAPVPHKLTHSGGGAEVGLRGERHELVLLLSLVGELLVKRVVVVGAAKLLLLIVALLTLQVVPVSHYSGAQ